jgi:hypothetical protein
MYIFIYVHIHIFKIFVRIKRRNEEEENDEKNRRNMKYQFKGSRSNESSARFLVTSKNYVGSNQGSRQGIYIFICMKWTH